VGDSRDVVVALPMAMATRIRRLRRGAQKNSSNIPLEPGIELVLKNEDDEELQARIESVNGDTVL
jgi:hypothetical protein